MLTMDMKFKGLFGCASFRSDFMRSGFKESGLVKSSLKKGIKVFGIKSLKVI